MPQMTAPNLVTNIDKLTTLSTQYKPVVSALGSGDSHKGASAFRPTIDGYQAIINAANNINQALDGTKLYKDADAQNVYKAFSNFVAVHQELLKVTIEKSNIDSILNPPVAAVLRNLESSLDILAFGIIGLVPAREADAQSTKDKLDETLSQAIKAYAGKTLGKDEF